MSLANSDISLSRPTSTPAGVTGGMLRTLLPGYSVNKQMFSGYKFDKNNRLPDSVMALSPFFRRALQGDLQLAMHGLLILSAKDEMHNLILGNGRLLPYSRGEFVEGRQ